MKKELIGIIICMLLVGSVLPVSGDIVSDKTPLSLISGNILYVGGDGPGNYTTIQDAINDAVDGDTVFVYNGTYYESLTINKEITLLGVDRETTIIDGLKEIFTIVKISANSVTISGFTIQNCNNSDYSGVGIKIIDGDYISINNNIISTNDKPYGKSHGIYHWTTISKYISITNNIFINNCYGIVVQSAPFINISKNVFRDNIDGIGCFYGSNTAIIKGNYINRCKYNGIIIESNYCIISKNLISNQKIWAVLRVIGGINVGGSNNRIINNNFFNNKRNAYTMSMPWENLWDSNYWGTPQTSPYLIFGTTVKYFELNHNHFGILFPIFDIDWHPAQEPYDIKNINLLEEVK